MQEPLTPALDTPHSPAPPNRREALLAALRARDRFPVVIVGAGINGLGTFRDLSLQGVDCLIVDRGDFCAGTSRAPSRMIHGGLKYLETGEFRLVSESVRERNLLLENAPRRVVPLQMLMPIRSWSGGIVSSIKRFLGLKAKFVDRGALIVKAGLSLYEFYGRDRRSLPRHEMIPRGKIDIAGLDPGIRMLASYYDGWVLSPERVAVELALDGMDANPGSIALNHVQCEGSRNGRLLLRDTVSDERFEIAADLVINAAGPWIDRVNADLHGDMRTPGTKLIGGTKGSHLLLRLPVLAQQLQGRMLYFGRGDGRICLITGCHGNVLVGATDLPIDDPDQAHCTEAEADYLLDAMREVLPNLRVGRDDILFTYCGVRPLPVSAHDDPGNISRDHSIAFHEADAARPFPVLSLIGGKWTTFRAFSAEATDLALGRLGRARRRDTRHHAIGGGATALPADHDAETQRRIAVIASCAPARARALLERYSGAAIDLATHLGIAGDMPLRTLPDHSRQELEYVAQHELVTGTIDLLLGRTWIFLQRRITTDMVAEISDLLGNLLHWNDTRRRLDRAEAAEHLRRRHRIDIADGRFVGDTE